jgi:hypothetical protein
MLDFVVGGNATHEDCFYLCHDYYLLAISIWHLAPKC